VNLERIRERLSNGFRPFIIELSSRRRIPVPHPEFIMIGRNVVVVLGNNDSVQTIDPLHITSIENMPASRRRR